MNIRGQQLKTSQESNIHHCSNLGSTVSGGFFFKKSSSFILGSLPILYWVWRERGVKYIFFGGSVLAELDDILVSYIYTNCLLFRNDKMISKLRRLPSQ